MIRDKIVVVGGCGHVGLPLSLILADSGYIVDAFDTSAYAVEQVNSGNMPFIEDGALSLLKQTIENGSFKAHVSPNCIRDAQIVIVVIGTPVDEHLSPDPNKVVETVTNLFNYMVDGQLILLRSTIYPGVTRKIYNLIKQEFPNSNVGYCPERIIEGQALSEIRALPQIIGTYDEKSLDLASEVFKRIGVNIVAASPEEAELAKLFTNVWRYIKFATANQFWMMANDLGVDFENVRRVITTDYPRASDLPKPGFTAGPCLFKDTMQLSALVQQNFALGNSAMMINEGIPGYLLEKIASKYDLANMTIGIAGMAFKADIDDSRSSLAYKLRKLLLFRCKSVIASDPYVKDSRLVSLEKLNQDSDLIIIGAPHSVYSEASFTKPVVDIWGHLDGSVLI